MGMSITTPQDHIYYLAEPKKKKMNKKNIIWLAVGIVLVILVGYFFWGQKIAFAPSKNTQATSTQQKNSDPVVVASSKIVVSGQIPGEVVLISDVTMDEAGWVAVHDNNNGQPGNILGAYYLPAGTYTNQMVPLLRGVVDGNSYLVVIHQDDGDKVFDYKIDTPITNAKDQLETANFAVVATSPRGE